MYAGRRQVKPSYKIHGYGDTSIILSFCFFIFRKVKRGKTHGTQQFSYSLLVHMHMHMHTMCVVYVTLRTTQMV